MSNVRTQFIEELKVSTPQINELLETQAARYAYWGTLATDANKVQRQAKLRAEIVEAQLKSQVRANWPEGGGQRSEAAIMTAVKLDPRWAEAWNQYFEAKHSAEVLQVSEKGFAQKKDLLVTIAANLRGEMSGQVRLKEESPNQVTPYTSTTLGGSLQQKIDLFSRQKET